MDAMISPDAIATTYLQSENIQMTEHRYRCEAALEAVRVRVTADGFGGVNRNVALGDEPSDVKIELRAR